MALPNLVTGSLRSKIDRILAFKQVVSTVALHGTKHDTTLHSSVRLFRCSTCRGTPIQAAKEYEKTRSLLPLHGSQASIANSFAVPVKETWSTTVGDLFSQAKTNPVKAGATAEHMAVSAKFLETLETKVAS